MSVLILGITGLIGHKLWQVLSKTHETIGTTRGTTTETLRRLGSGVILQDIAAEHIDKIENAISVYRPKNVINCIGVTRRKIKAYSTKDIIYINSLFPHLLNEMCKKYDSRLIHLSPDGVFSGKRGLYSEEDIPDATDLYGTTKTLGEVSTDGALTIRTSVIGHQIKDRTGTVEWFLSQKNDVAGSKTSIFSGFPSVVFANILDKYILTDSSLSGILHICSSPIDKFSLFTHIRKEYDFLRIVYPDFSEHIDRSLVSSKFSKRDKLLKLDWTKMIAEMHSDNLVSTNTKRFDNKLISILVPAYNSYQYIGECIDSLKKQDLPVGWELEIIIGVDGCEKTLKAAKRLLGTDKRIRLFYASRNRGTYFIRNAIARYAKGSIVGIFDSDDVMFSGNLKKCIDYLENNSGVDILSFGEERTDANLNPLTSMPNHIKMRGGDGVALFTRQVLDKLGGWEAWECGADTEFLSRAQAMGFVRGLLGEVGQYYRTHDSQLTQTIPMKSKQREIRRKEILERRSSWKAKTSIPQKIVPVCAEVREIFSRKDPVHICLATIPSREESLKMVVEQALTQMEEYDRLHVCLNGYERVPEFLSADPRIDVVRSDNIGDKGDAGKFYWLGRVRGYYLSIDDDISYPNTYVMDLVHKIEFLNREVVVGYHGVDYPVIKPLEKLNERLCYPVFSRVEHDRWVHCLGTGCCGFHTDLLPRATWDIFEIPNMADVWFAKYCLEQNVPMKVLAHDKGYLQHFSDMSIISIQRSCFSRTNDVMDTTMTQIRVINDTRWVHKDNDIENTSIKPSHVEENTELESEILPPNDAAFSKPTLQKRFSYTCSRSSSIKSMQSKRFDKTRN